MQEQGVQRLQEEGPTHPQQHTIQCIYIDEGFNKGLGNMQTDHCSREVELLWEPLLPRCLIYPLHIGIVIEGSLCHQQPILVRESQCKVGLLTAAGRQGVRGGGGGGGVGGKIRML